MTDSMKPMDVCAPVLIPKGNLDPTNPGTFGGIRAAFDKANGSSTKILSRTMDVPSFKPGYTTKGLEGDWQTMTNSTLIK